MSFTTRRGSNDKGEGIFPGAFEGPSVVKKMRPGGVAHPASRLKVHRRRFSVDFAYGEETAVVAPRDVRLGEVTLTQQQQHLSSSLAFMQASS